MVCAVALALVDLQAICCKFVVQHSLDAQLHKNLELAGNFVVMADNPFEADNVADEGVVVAFEVGDVGAVDDVVYEVDDVGVVDVAYEADDVEPVVELGDIAGADQADLLALVELEEVAASCKRANL